MCGSIFAIFIICFFFFFKQKTAYEMRISVWSSDVCSSDLPVGFAQPKGPALRLVRAESDGPRCLAYRMAARAAEILSRSSPPEIGRASCRERVCQYV